MFFLRQRSVSRPRNNVCQERRLHSELLLLEVQGKRLEAETRPTEVEVGERKEVIEFNHRGDSGRRETRRGQAGLCWGDHLSIREEGVYDKATQVDHDDESPGGEILRRAQEQTLLQRARLVHLQRTRRRDSSHRE